MSLNLIFASIIFFCFAAKIETNMKNKLIEHNLNIQNTTHMNITRKLSEPHPIKIHVDTSQLEDDLKKSAEELNAFKNAVKKAIEYIQKIIKMKTETSPIDVLKYIDRLDKDFLQSIVKPKYEGGNNNIDADLIIFVRRRDDRQTMYSFSEIGKIASTSDDRVIVGYMIYNDIYDYDSNYDVDYNHREYLLTVIFMHEIIHFLGFDSEILNKKGLIRQKAVESRIKKNVSYKFIVINQEVLNFAEKYFGETITEIEFNEKSNSEDLSESHWEGRLLLGDIMTLDLYYPEVVISEFTLKLLEQLGWYEINYYTGGLMKFGKGQKKAFIDNDCIDIINDKVLFPKEFCSESFGTCSFGRQSRAYCGNGETIPVSDIYEYTRNSYTKGYGLEMVEYCPVSISIPAGIKNYYYIGSCNNGNKKYGEGLMFLDGQNSHTYNEFSNAFEEVIGENSFCALSSIIKKNDYNSMKNLYEKLIRPTCYIMSCSEKSLTIQIGSEYIVCPRLGGIVKIEGSHTNYKGYLFCPDYNLICTGTELCNNLFDCIDKKSAYKETAFNKTYYTEPITYNSEMNINNEDGIKQDSISDKNYELSEDGICPLNCSQCIANKRCTLCGNSNNYYLGDNEEDSSSPIKCNYSRPQNGYYKRNDTHYYKCVEGCDHCEGPTYCDYCFPQFYLSPDRKKCIERIPNCIKYNESSKFTDKNNANQIGYETCEQCDNDNNFYCVDLDKKHCVEVTNIETYYKMEFNTKYPCMGDCNIKFPHCIRCNINTCNICDPKFYFNDAHNCTERIPNCKVFDGLYIDDKTNNGGEGYSSCKECETDHYCYQGNKSICKEIKNLTGYYNYDNDGCKDACENIFTPICLECVKDRCTNCLTRLKSDNINCVKGIDHCVWYDKDKGNDTYIECLLCDKDNSYYCIDDIRTVCKKVNISLFYPLKRGETYTCYQKCDVIYPGCEKCDQKCLTCKPKFKMDGDECFLEYVQQIPDDCRVVIDEINVDIEEIDFEDLVQNYFEKTFSYLNIVYHYVNKKYTVTIFINSDCTESLLEQGYYKIDSKDLNQIVAQEINLRTVRNEFIIHCFIQYNNNNHFRLHNYNSKYIQPKVNCTQCVDIPFTLTNKYNNTISVALGPILSSAIVLEKLDIFSKDSEVFTDLCQNVTLEGVDIPLNDRLHYLYLEDYTTQLACGGDNCEILEINKEESISVCRCKINEYNDLFKENVIKMAERPEIQSSSSDSFGIIKCTKNGFHAHNVRTNGGFYICLIVIVAVGFLILCYFLCSKIITTSEKGLNPPSKIKNRLRIASNWDKTEEERKKMKKNTEELMNDFQPRDGHEDDLYEEEKDYSYIYFDLSNSFDTALFDKKLNNRGRGDKTRKILVLLPGTKKNQTEEDNFSSSESSPLDDASRKKKKTFCQIYWHVLSLKQHIINFFSFCTCINITESYIPLPIRIIRSLFLVILSFLFSILFLDQKYYSKKFKYFNEKYKLVAGTTDGVTITPEEVAGGVPSGELWKYSFTHTFVNGLIVFVLLLVAQFLIGVAFFSLRNKVIEVLKKNDTSGINELVSQTRIKYLVFFIIVGVLLFLFLFVFIAFGGAYGGGFSDYFLPGIVALIFLEIFPFLWSLIISLLYYLGIKQKSKCCRQVSRFFMF
jgi:hypothetical protein